MLEVLENSLTKFFYLKLESQNRLLLTKTSQQFTEMFESRNNLFHFKCYQGYTVTSRIKAVKKRFKVMVYSSAQILRHSTIHFIQQCVYLIPRTPWTLMSGGCLSVSRCHGCVKKCFNSRYVMKTSKAQYVDEMVDVCLCFIV